MSTKLVAYFSATGTTKEKALRLAAAANADTFEIEPAVPYTKADLDWMNKKSRSSIEMADKSFRPAVKDGDAHIDDYDTIFLCFPIWWYVAPTIINTFLEKYDFTGKKIILAATSGGSGFGKTREGLMGSVKGGVIVEGKILNGSLSDAELKKWVETV